MLERGRVVAGVEGDLVGAEQVQAPPEGAPQKPYRPKLPAACSAVLNAP